MRRIRKTAVLGSGVMGSQIACHLANIGLEVLLLDIVPKAPNDAEKAKGLTLKDKAVRNRLANEHLQKALKSDPSPIYTKKYAGRITTGNFEDDLDKMDDVDWIVEAVLEDLKIKQNLFEKVEKHRKPGTIITTNTSGIPVNLMLQGRSDDFQKHFCGTHFFNPPRYLELLEIIPTDKTDPEVITFLEDYGDRFLGKTTVICKDTPAFIANRIGVYGLAATFHLMTEMDLTVDEIDVLTGPVIGRPKSATFRTCDLVGVDTLVKVMDGVHENCKDDEARDIFKAPAFVRKMVEKGWTGSKAAQGFYKKVKDKEGKREILSLDRKSFEYQPRQRPKFETYEMVKPVGNLGERLQTIVKGKDKSATFFKKFHYGLFTYVSNRVPEIADEIYKVDDALKAGFGWKLGPFETWDVLDVKRTVEYMEKEGHKPARWIKTMLDKGVTAFYRSKDGKRQYYDLHDKDYKDVPGTDKVIYLGNYRQKDHILWQNDGATLFDIGDGVLNLEFHSKSNTIGGEVLEGINKAIDVAEEKYAGLVIGNEGDNFSAGANVGMIFMFAVEQEFDELDFAVRRFQQTMMRVRHSAVPVVAAPHGLTLGGACELCLHADSVVSAAETYIGLVEVGVGLIPAGGGSKEMTMRTADAFYDGDPELPHLQETLLNLAQAKVGRSAVQGFELGFLRKGQDKIVVNKNHIITAAKAKVLELAGDGYTAPLPRTDIKVQGKPGLGLFYTGAYAMLEANYITEHDHKVAKKLAYVMCGGDLSGPGEVPEQYLLDLEREAFLALCGERKTMERLESVIKKGKPVRN